MQIKASVAAVMLAFAGTAAWAGEGVPASDNGAAAAADGWQFMNGEPVTQSDGARAAGSSSLDADEQAKTSLGFTEGDQGDENRGARESGGDRMAGTDAQSGESAGSAESANDAAMSEREGDRFTAAAPEGQSESEAPAIGEDQSGQPADAQEQDSADQPAHSPREPDAGQATSSDGSESGQAARSVEQDDQEMAGAEEGDEQSAQAEDEESGSLSADSGMPAKLQGKVVVIIPRDWEGSLEGLLSALQGSPDAKDIVIVKQGNPGEQVDPQADSSVEPDDSYEASRPTPPLNQQ